MTERSSGELVRGLTALSAAVGRQVSRDTIGWDLMTLSSDDLDRVHPGVKRRLGSSLMGMMVGCRAPTLRRR
ncbi:hypothetical protein ABT404_08375 [Streptomyces hyaluromycini]|uniref:Uncharacterized protein n=1 Tax=Streptomyces hyaluromycini TaxID=1377993 RepID=A0ABV1WRK6_9ACTN